MMIGVSTAPDPVSVLIVVTTLVTVPVETISVTARIWPRANGFWCVGGTCEKSATIFGSWNCVP